MAPLLHHVALTERGPDGEPIVVALARSGREWLDLPHRRGRRIWGRPCAPPISRHLRRFFAFLYPSRETFCPDAASEE